MRQSFKKITLIALFASFTFVATSVKIDIPLAGGNTMVHLGNALCIVSGILLGPILGGLSAGIGSFLFDLFSPFFITSAPFSFVFKFILSSVSSLIYNCKILKNSKILLKVLVASFVSSFLYIVLHLSKVFIYNFCFLKVPISVCMILIVKSLSVSIINLMVSMLVSAFTILKFKKRICFNKFVF